MSQSISLCYGKISFLEGGWGWWLMISVIVPVYKVEPYLQQCVDSILNQTYRDLEVLLIDDGSPDKCGEICDEYEKKDKRIRVFHTENRGLSAARNLGLREAKGDYIGFVDSDDWIEPDMYEELLRRVEETGADIATSGFWVEFSDSSQKSMSSLSVYEGTESLKALLDQKISNHVWNKLYRKDLLNADPFPDKSNHEDIATMHKFLNAAQVVATVPDSKYHYRQRTDSITKTHTAKNLIAYTDAYIGRYNFLKAEQPGLFLEKSEEIILSTAVGVSRLWRWWHGCTQDEKRKFDNQINELVTFSRTHYPLFGCSSWPGYLRISAFFMHSKNSASFAVMYWLNQLFRQNRKQELFQK